MVSKVKKKKEVSIKQLNYFNKYEDHLKSLTSIKCPLRSIVRNNDIIHTIKHSVKQVNLIMVHVYQVIKFYYLHKFNIDKKKTPIIDKNLVANIVACFTVTNHKVTNKVQKEDENDIEFQIDNHNKDILDFYNKHYKQLLDPSFRDINRNNLNNTLQYEAISLVTNFENHIKNHFEDMLNRFINIMTKKKEFEFNIRNNIAITDKTEQIKAFRKTLTVLKNDILNDTNICVEYNQLKIQTRKMFPNIDAQTGFHKYMEQNPMLFLNTLIEMSILEKNYPQLKSVKIEPK